MTASFGSGSFFLCAIAGCESKNFGSSSLSTARSIPGAMASTVAATLSPAWLAWISTWLAYKTTCAFVKMRFPGIIVPLPEISAGGCFVQGRYRSGCATVENTFTTEFSIETEGVTPGPAGPPFVTGGVSTRGVGELGDKAAPAGAE